MFKGDLRKGLTGFFWMFLVGFAILFGLMAGLAWAGLDRGTLAVIFVAATMLAYAAFGLLSHSAAADDWFVAGRQVTPVFNGMAKAAGWISGPVFIALAGGLAFDGQGWMAFLVGWSGGLLLMAVLLAPYMRKAGSYTVTEFIGTRYGGALTPLIAVAILVVVAFTLLAAQLSMVGTVFEQMLGLPHVAGIWLGLLCILFCTVPGGLRSATWVKVAQLVVLMIAFLVPVIWMSLAQGYGFFPQFAYGAFERLGELRGSAGAPADGGAEAFAGMGTLADGPGATGGAFGAWRFMALAICLAAGGAVMPHVLLRVFTASSARGAGRSVAWSLLFVLVIALTAPALATLTSLQMLDSGQPGALAGQPVEQAAATDWVARWSGNGALRIEDLNADGVLQANEIAMRPEVLTLAAPEIAGIPVVLSGLVAAGGIAAALSTGIVSLLAIATSLGHDVHYGWAERGASIRRRIGMARGLAVVFGALAAWLATVRVLEPLEVLAWASSFAASGLFFPLVLAVWWRRATQPGAIAGMVFGFAAGAVYAWLVYAGGMEPWFGLDAPRFGVFGLAVSVVAMVAVSLLTPAPDGPTRLLIDEIRRPYGPAILPRTH